VTFASASLYAYPFTGITVVASVQDIPPLTPGTPAEYGNVTLGTCIAVFNWDGYVYGVMSGTLNCTGLTSGTTFASAHLHYTGSDVCGDTGGVFYTLGPTFSFNFTSSYDIDSFCQGYTYLNVHTGAYPGGEVRANVIGNWPQCYTGQPASALSQTSYTLVEGATHYNTYRYPYVRYLTASDGLTPPVKHCEMWYGYDTSYMYLSGTCTGLSGNLDEVRLESADGISFFSLWSGSTLYPCVATQRWEFYNSFYYSDVESVCTAAVGQNWKIVIATDTTPPQTISGAHPSLTNDAGACPPIYGGTPFGPTGPTVGPVPVGPVPPVPVGPVPPVPPVPVGPVPPVPPTPVAPTTPAPSAGFTITGTLLITLVIALISVWLN